MQIPTYPRHPPQKIHTKTLWIETRECTMNYKSCYATSTYPSGTDTKLHGILTSMKPHMFVGYNSACAHGLAATDNGKYASIIKKYYLTKICVYPTGGYEIYGTL